jgi:hypothetical protein
VRDFNEMLLAKSTAEMTSEEKKTMEDSAFLHENRVSYLLGQHDLDLMKSNTEKANQFKKTNLDSSSTSTFKQLK